MDVHELYECNVTRYDCETREGGLFAGYIVAFLKLKPEASGYPAWGRIPADEKRYVESFCKSEGIWLDSESSLSLLNVVWRNCLKSMWVKLTERNDRTRTKIITEPH